MDKLNTAVNYILTFQPYVLLPIILFIFSLIFHIRLNKALKSSLTIGIGFIGIFIIFGYFIKAIGPAVQALVSKTGLHFNVLDVGWTPLAAIAWSYKLAPIMMLVILFMNVLLLMLRLTKTVNIDIWNFWHFILLGAIVFEVTQSIVLSLLATLTVEVLALKLSDWCAKAAKNFSGLDGVSTTTISGTAYFPFALVVDAFIDRVPILNKLNANPENIRKKLGIMGEPMVIGFIMGMLLGIGAGYDVKNILNLAFEIAAVIYILPMMSGILGKGLMPISDGMKDFMKKKFPKLENTLIGLDLAIYIGNSSAIVTGLLLMPFALLFAFTLPGVRFIPLGDLANLIGAAVMVVIAMKGNIVRSVIAFLPIIIAKLYVASYMAEIYTSLAQKSNFKFEGYEGTITSFLDGGNVAKFWIVTLFEGNWIAILFIPVVILLLLFCWKKTVKA